MGTFAPALDVGAEFGVEVLDGIEHAAAPGLAFDQLEPPSDERWDGLTKVRTLIA